MHDIHTCTSPANTRTPDLHHTTLAVRSLTALNRVEAAVSGWQADTAVACHTRQPLFVVRADGSCSSQGASRAVQGEVFAYVVVSSPFKYPPCPPKSTQVSPKEAGRNVSPLSLDSLTKQGRSFAHRLGTPAAGTAPIRHLRPPCHLLPLRAARLSLLRISCLLCVSLVHPRPCLIFPVHFLSCSFLLLVRHVPAGFITFSCPPTPRLMLLCIFFLFRISPSSLSCPSRFPITFSHFLSEHFSCVRHHVHVH